MISIRHIAMAGASSKQSMPIAIATVAPVGDMAAAAEYGGGHRLRSADQYVRGGSTAAAGSAHRLRRRGTRDPTPELLHQGSVCTHPVRVVVHGHLTAPETAIAAHENGPTSTFPAG